MARRPRRIQLTLNLEEGAVKQLAMKELLRLIDDSTADAPDPMSLARELAWSHRTVSVPMLQRRLRIADPDEAQQIIEQLVAEGIVEAGRGETYDVIVRPVREEPAS